jgi:hypothetical protein
MARKRKMRGRGKALDPRQRAFVLAYVANGGNATQAALDAGYTSNQNSAKTIGWELVHLRANVAEEIARLREVAARNAQADATYILRSIKEVADACKVRRYELDEKTGAVTERGVVDSPGALKALELLGKNQRLFVESLDVNMRSELSGVSDEELMRVLRQAQGEAGPAGGTEKKGRKGK